MSDVVIPAQKQLEAYNNRDIEAFMSCYGPDVVVEDGAGNVRMENWEVMKERYAAMFAANPNLHCELVSRIVIGQYVVDEEHVTGRGEGVKHAVAIYRVENGLIRHVRFL